MATQGPERCCEAHNFEGHYDLAVLGAGSGGFSAAIAAAESGARVAMVGHGTIGGTCVNVGCVPSKTLIRAAEAIHAGRSVDRFHGLIGEARLMDWRRLVAQKDELVDQLRDAKYRDLLKAYPGIAYIEGRARFEEDGLSVEGRTLTADRVVIATGSRPSVPEIAGLDEIPYLTSTTALELETLPRSMAIVGGGYIGCELAQMFARAGVEVSIFCRSRLLPEAEPEISEVLTDCFRAEDIAVNDGVTYRRFDREDERVSLIFERDATQQRRSVEAVVVCTGRTPNTEDLNLGSAGIRTDRHGGIVVDEHMQTTKHGVFAVGDVTNRDQYVYMAAHGGRIAALNALNDDELRYDSDAIPSVIFTDPQVASVGMTEAHAKAGGYEVRTSVFPLGQLPRALAARDTRGLIKLVADAKTERLLGAHILAPEGGDSIQTAVLAIKMGLTTSQLGSLIFPYLTTVEGLKLAAQAFDKDVAKLSCCAG